MPSLPVVETSPNSRRIVVRAPSAHGTRLLVERYGRDRAGQRRPVAIVRPGEPSAGAPP